MSPSISMSQTVTPANSVWHGHLDVSKESLQANLPNPLLLRGLADGQWMAGLKENVWSLDHNDKPRLHIAAYSTWRVDNGDSEWGVMPSIPINPLVTKAIAATVDALSFGSINHEPELKFFDMALEVGAFVGWRPSPQADVDHNRNLGGHLDYGYSITLSKALSAAQVAKKYWDGPVIAKSDRYTSEVLDP